MIIPTMGAGLFHCRCPDYRVVICQEPRPCARTGGTRARPLNVQPPRGGGTRTIGPHKLGVQPGVPAMVQQAILLLPMSRTQGDSGLYLFREAHLQGGLVRQPGVGIQQNYSDMDLPGAVPYISCLHRVTTANQESHWLVFGGIKKLKAPTLPCRGSSTAAPHRCLLQHFLSHQDLPGVDGCGFISFPTSFTAISPELPIQGPFSVSQPGSDPASIS